MDISPEITELGLSMIIKELEGSESQETCQKVWEYFFGEPNGQCRTDRKWQYHDMVGVRLGHSGSPLYDEERNDMKPIEMNEIHIGQSHLDKTYTILDGSYTHFITDTLHHHLGDPCWFLPSKGLNRSSVYEGELAAVLTLIGAYWDEFYEFTVSALDLSWMVDYNHHHAIIIYGDQEAARAQFLCNERRKWQDKILSCNFYPKFEKD